MLDELRQLAIFARTVEHGSFRAAAQALGVSPSVVSHHVAQLERRLGTALLYRSTRKLSLTDDGRRLLVDARAMVEAAESGLRALSDRASQPSGILRVTVPALLAQSGLLDRMAAFSLDYPGVELRLDFTDERRELIATGMDLAIRMGSMRDSTLIARRLEDMERVLVVHPRLLDERPPPKTPRDLGSWNWLALDPAQRRVDFRSRGRAAVRVAPTPRIRVNDAQALSRLVCSGAGIAVVPEFLVRDDLAAGRLTRLLPKWSVDPVGVFAVWPSNASKNGLTARFVRALAA